MKVLDNYRGFLLAITVYTFVCMLIGSTTITWNTVAVNFGLLIAVIIISPFFNRENDYEIYTKR